MRSTPELEAKLAEQLSKGVLVSRTENNRYLKVSYKGANTLISEKWNIKIYTSGSIVCNDTHLLKKIMEDDLNSAPSLPLISIDDAGIGFPICGVMVGATDGHRVVTDVVDVSFFRSGLYESKAYLKEYATKGAMLIIKEFGASPATHRIEICTGYINTSLRDMLRAAGYDVRVTEIKGLLQNSLEDRFREYVKKEAKADLAYDPKIINESALARKYYAVVDWAKKYRPDLLKTGWKALN